MPDQIGRWSRLTIFCPVLTACMAVHRGTSSTVSAALSIISSAAFPTTGTTDIIAPVTLMGTVATFVKKQPERCRSSTKNSTNRIVLISSSFTCQTAAPPPIRFSQREDIVPMTLARCAEVRSWHCCHADYLCHEDITSRADPMRLKKKTCCHYRPWSAFAPKLLPSKERL